MLKEIKKLKGFFQQKENDFRKKYRNVGRNEKYQKG